MKEQFSLRRRGETDDIAAVHGVDDIVPEPVEDEEIVAPEEQEQAEVIQRLPTPFTPTRSDLLDHRATHCPFWAACPDCVEGRGKEFGHFTCPTAEGVGIPTVSFDYGFMGENDEETMRHHADLVFQRS